MPPEVIELTEYDTCSLPNTAIPAELGELLWRDHAGHVDVEFPSPKTGGEWRLTSKGFVGRIPLETDLSLALRPKVELGNVFGMLEYAYRLDPQFLRGVTDSASLDEFYERLGNILAQRVLDRARKGLYRDYVSHRETLPFLRGRLDVHRALRRPWDPALPCSFETHTADVEENQILAWTLSIIARSGICTERVLPTIRQAYRTIHGPARPMPISATACEGRLYNRLNDDYRPMHALCRFFLSSTGPSHTPGEHRMMPFLIDMASLFEEFVAEWLERHLPRNYELEKQEYVHLDPSTGLHFRVDLVLYDSTRRALCVIDTKYKATQTATADDVAQVVAYAKSKGCDRAILAYPTPLPKPLRTSVGDIDVRSMSFDLAQAIPSAGGTFIKALMRFIDPDDSYVPGAK